MNDDLLQARIIELEIKTSYQEDTIQALNDIVAVQQEKMALFEGQLQYLNKQIQSLQSNLEPSNKNEPPPHY